MTIVDLCEAWGDLLRRRARLEPTLAPYGEILTLWASTSVEVAPLGWSAAECQHRWERGVPLLAEAPTVLTAAATEALLGPVMELVAEVVVGTGEPLAAFADAWDQGQIDPAALLPAKGRIGSVDSRLGLDPDLLAFVIVSSLRPLLEAYFTRSREYLGDGLWFLGVCPFCGAPPGFADVVEDGRRRLACHLCGGGWIIARLSCPFCGDDSTKDAVRLEAEAGDEGYAISACRRCRAYVKQLDRRVRWNGGPALVEDWGSPHLDLVARRAGYWRAVPTLVELQQARMSPPPQS